MGFTKLLFFLIVLTFIEIIFIPFPFVFVALFLWSQFRSEEEALVLAFLLGLLIDILLLRTMGETSFLFLTLLWLTMLYKRKYRHHHGIFLAAFAFLSLLVLEYFYQSSLLLLRAFFGTIVILFLAKMHFKIEESYESW